MAKRDIVVVGASAGGINALLDLVKSLPDALEAAIFVVLHTSPYSPGRLPQMLNRQGTLKASFPEDGEKVKKGHIYIAPPDHHLILEEHDRIAVRKGPKENRFRPSVDALFRSAALHYGPRVAGIVLSGMLDDGTSGMWSIKQNGGLAIIQEPGEALYPSMPQNVTQYVEVDHVLPAASIGGLLARITSEHAPKRPDLTKEDMDLLKMEVIIATRDNAFELGILDKGELTTFTCPECHGALVSIEEGQMIRYRCHTGHAYTSSTLLAGITTMVEEKLWQAMQALEATNILLNQIAAHYKRSGNTKAYKQFTEKAEEIARKARVVHDSVFNQELMSEDIRHENDL